MEIELTLERKGARERLLFHYGRMVNAGYTGRNQDEVRRHIEELAATGVSGPKRTPSLYPVICRMLVLDDQIEVYGHETCGEVEYVLLIRNDGEVFVGLGSDHTDRHLERMDIPRSKQIAPNVISRTVWPLDEVEDHWDDLIMRSRQIRNGQDILYQEGRLALLLPPRRLMDFVRSELQCPLREIIIFSGTIGNLTGGFVYWEKFIAELVDEKLGRLLDLLYRVRPLDYLALE